MAVEVPGQGPTDVDPAPGGGRRIASLLRGVRLFSAGVLLLLAATGWGDDWAVPGIGPGAAGLVIVLWLVATNLWSQRHDATGEEQAGVGVEITSDLLLVLTLVVVGGTTVLASLPLAAVLVVVEAAARWPFRRAAVATAVFALAWATAILTDWPSWAGWDAYGVDIALVTPLASLPIALVIVGRLARERDQSRAVSVGQAGRLRATAVELRAANHRLAVANEELSAFAGRIAHDLRSPLGTVVTALDTVRRPDIELPRETQDLLLDQARKTARRSIDTISALLAHATAEGRAADVALVDLREVTTDVLVGLPVDMVGEVRVEPPAEPSLVWADPSLLPVVVQNLVANALTHGGRDLSRVTVWAEEDADGVVVTVADDGAGIPVDRRGSVFDSGSREGPGRGLGLGLATCRSIVARHGGRIWVEDGTHGGAAVRFTLPWPEDEGPARTDRAGTREVIRLDEEAGQRLLATSRSSGSSTASEAPSYRPGSAPTTVTTSSPACSASPTSCGTV